MNPGANQQKLDFFSTASVRGLYNYQSTSIPVINLTRDYSQELQVGAVQVATC